MMGQNSLYITPLSLSDTPISGGEFFYPPFLLVRGIFLFHFAQKNNCFTKNAYIIKLLICVNKWLIGGIFGI